ncbi:MAG: hypothetical protein M3O31_13960, partial [Acidobacteriota bacterium]|nr:hypothetical protein [Acidobacteriota bacterium]
MKSILILVLLVASLTNGAIAQTTTLALPETNGSITVSFVPFNKRDDTYHSFTIVSGGRKAKFVPKDPILRVPASAEARKQGGFFTDIAGLKLHSSRFFLVGHY